MGPLKSYDVVIDGNATTLRLSDDDAKRRGVFGQHQGTHRAPEVKVAPAPRNTGRRQAPNKARQPSQVQSK